MAVVAAIVGSLGLLIGNVDRLIRSVDHLVENFRERNGDDSRPYPQCVRIAVEHQPVVPYSLQHNVWATEALYWLAVEATNECDEAVVLRVACEPTRADALVEGAEECGEYPAVDVQSGKTEKRQIDPILKIRRPFADPVSVDLRIEIADERRERTLVDDVRNVTVLPRTKFLWDLKNTSREAVLATLAVWTVRPRGEVARMGSELANGYESIDAWMRRAYDRVFEGLEIVVDDRWIPPPPGVDWIDISTPEAILANRRAIPMEAALLFGALGYEVIRDRGARIILISTREGDEAMEAPSVFVAWQSAEDLGRLRAVATSSGRSMSFEEATGNANGRLRELRESILEELNAESSNGVYYGAERNGLVVALELGRAISRHRFTGGLPNPEPSHGEAVGARQ